MDKTERQRQHFNSIAEEYYQARRGEKHLQYKHRLFHYALDGLKVEGRKAAVLEPMCGYGEGREIVEKYISEDIDYEGFDYSDVLVRKINDAFPEIKVFVQDVTRYHPEPDSYDIIILIGGLHHVPDSAKDVVKHLCRGLKEGGIFINFEPTSNNPFIKLARDIIYKRNHLFDEKTERAFTLREYNKMFEDAGMKIERQLYPGLLGYVMYYNPDAFPILNRGTVRTVDRIFAIERGLYTNIVGRTFSFCTLSIFRK